MSKKRNKVSLKDTLFHIVEERTYPSEKKSTSYVLFEWGVKLGAFNLQEIRQLHRILSQIIRAVGQRKGVSDEQ